MLGGDLGECNRQLLLQHRRHIIEQAYRASKQADYHMPRWETEDEELPSERISTVYDLYAQNQLVHPPTSARTLVPVRELRRLNTPPALPLAQTRTGMKCTLSTRKMTMVSRQLAKPRSKSQGWCCWREQELEELRTREISMDLGREGCE